MMILDFIGDRLRDAQPSVDRVRASLAADPSGRQATPYADAQVTRFNAMQRVLEEARQRGYPSDPGHDAQVWAVAMRWATHCGYPGVVACGGL